MTKQPQAGEYWRMRNGQIAKVVDVRTDIKDSPYVVIGWRDSLCESWTIDGHVSISVQPGMLDLVEHLPDCTGFVPELKYVPFANAAEFMPHANRWLRYKNNTRNHFVRVDAFDDDSWFLSGVEDDHDYETMLDEYVFADDGTPCGRIVE